MASRINQKHRAMPSPSRQGDPEVKRHGKGSIAVLDSNAPDNFNDMAIKAFTETQPKRTLSVPVPENIAQVFELMGRSDGNDLVTAILEGMKIYAESIVDNPSIYGYDMTIKMKKAYLGQL